MRFTIAAILIALVLPTLAVSSTGEPLARKALVIAKRADRNASKALAAQHDLGPEGPPGRAGERGTDGQNGVNGVDGAKGAAGADGQKGDASPSGVYCALRTDAQTLAERFVSVPGASQVSIAGTTPFRSDLGTHTAGVVCRKSNGVADVQIPAERVRVSVLAG